MRISFGPTANALFLLVCSSTLICGQTDVETSAAEASQALIKAHVAWKTKLSSPGASIQAKQTGRQGSLVTYSLFVSGLPSDKVYTYMSWPVGQAKPSPVMQGVTIGKGGVLMCAGRTSEQCGDASKKDDPIDFTFNPAKGEPYRLALVSGDNRVAFVIVPDPIFAKDKDCTLSVERLLPHFELAYFAGAGFPPNSDVSFDSESYGEKHPVKTKADNEGNIQFALTPFVSGQHKGTTTIKGVGMTCSPSIKFDWGS
jgi:hypothetical protein